MSMRPLAVPRFVRKTRLAPGEYRKNFHQLDADVVAALSSPEADRVTPLMSKIYLRLVSAPTECWEREGVLYFAARDADGHLVKSSKVLYEQLGVASATAHKALAWMHEQGIIGYFAGKNGAGIRIFLNRAASSIGSRDGVAGKKILPFAPGSNAARRGSTVEPAFKDSFADPESLDSDIDPRAPKGGAPELKTRVGEETSVLDHLPPSPNRSSAPPSSAHGHPGRADANQGDGDELVERLARKLVPHVRSAAAREHERTREWFITHALPKAIRVSQRSAYDVLRAHGLLAEARAEQARQRRGHAVNLRVGANHAPVPPAQPLVADEIREVAEICVALLEAQGRPIERTLAEMSTDAGGFLLLEDVPTVRALAESLRAEAAKGQGTQ